MPGSIWALNCDCACAIRAIDTLSTESEFLDGYVTVWLEEYHERQTVAASGTKMTTPETRRVRYTRYLNKEVSWTHLCGAQPKETELPAEPRETREPGADDDYQADISSFATGLNALLTG